MTVEYTHRGQDFKEVAYFRDEEGSAFSVTFTVSQNLSKIQSQYFGASKMQWFKYKSNGERVFSIILNDPKEIAEVVERLAKDEIVPKNFVDNVCRDCRGSAV